MAKKKNKAKKAKPSAKGKVKAKAKKPAKKIKKKRVVNNKQTYGRAPVSKLSATRMLSATTTGGATPTATIGSFLLECDRVEVIVVLAADEITVHNGEGVLVGPGGFSLTIAGSQIIGSSPVKWIFTENGLTLASGTYTFKVVVQKQYEFSKSVECNGNINLPFVP